MILTGGQILQAHRNGDILVDPFDEGQLQPASYDLRVGAKAITVGADRLVDIDKSGYLSLRPGEFALITTREVLRLGPQYVARFGLRSKHARKGLIVTSGPQVDPGFHGPLHAGVTNLTARPIPLAYGDDFLSVEFHRLGEAATEYRGPYQNLISFTPEEIEQIIDRRGMILSEAVDMLGEIGQRVRDLETQAKMVQWFAPLTLAIVALILSSVTLISNLRSHSPTPSELFSGHPSVENSPHQDRPPTR